ncbi:MAG: MauE/DoxX family redox-associated membrane protein [Planctomycetota bacterium]
MSAWRRFDIGLTMLVRVFLAGVFGFAAYMKLQNPQAAQAFAESIKAFGILEEGAHDHVLRLSTFAVPWTEAICAVLLLIGFRTRAAGFVLLAAMGVFIWAVADVLAGGRSVQCGCFGDFSWPCGDVVGSCHLWRNGVLAALCLFAVVRGGGPASIDGLLHGSGGKPEDDAGPAGAPEAPDFGDRPAPPPARAVEVPLAPASTTPLSSPPAGDDPGGRPRWD